MDHLLSKEKENYTLNQNDESCLVLRDQPSESLLARVDDNSTDLYRLVVEDCSLKTE